MTKRSSFQRSPKRMAKASHTQRSMTIAIDLGDKNKLQPASPRNSSPESSLSYQRALTGSGIG